MLIIFNTFIEFLLILYLLVINVYSMLIIELNMETLIKMQE